MVIVSTSNGFNSNMPATAKSSLCRTEPSLFIGTYAAGDNVINFRMTGFVGKRGFVNKDLYAAVEGQNKTKGHFLMPTNQFSFPLPANISY